MTLATSAHDRAAVAQHGPDVGQDLVASRPRSRRRRASRRRRCPTWPASTTKSPARTAGEYGPATGGAPAWGQAATAHRVDSIGLVPASAGFSSSRILLLGAPGVAVVRDTRARGRRGRCRPPATTPRRRPRGRTAGSRRRIASPSSRSYAVVSPGWSLQRYSSTFSPVKPSPEAFDPDTDRDAITRVELEAEVVRVVGQLLVLGEHVRRRAGAARPAPRCTCTGRYLPGTDVERHARPSATSRCAAGPRRTSRRRSPARPRPRRGSPRTGRARGRRASASRSRRTRFSLPSRSSSTPGPTGGSIASSATVWKRWFWMTSRSAPTSS